MKHGDISNVQGYVIGVRVDDNLVKYKTKFHLNISLNIEVDDDMLKLLQYIYRRTEHTVVLICDRGGKYKDKLNEFAEMFPFELECISGESEISRKLLTGEITYYIDNNDYRRSIINSEYAVSLDEFNTILKRKGRSI